MVALYQRPREAMSARSVSSPDIGGSAATLKSVTKLA